MKHYYIFYNDNKISGYLETETQEKFPNAKEVTAQEYCKITGISYESILQELKQEKITSLSATCEQTIYAGLEFELSEGAERFEYKDKDQKNIEAMFYAIVFGATCYPYQSEDGNCRIFTKEDIMTLYPSLEGLRTSQLTYYNQLKKYVNTLETAEEINSVTYGQPLEGEYLQHYNEMLAVAQEQMQLVLSKVTSNVT